MIDTVVLTFPEKDFKVLDHKKFNPSSRALFVPPYYELGKIPYFKCVYNPAINEGDKYKYLPRLTLIKALRKTGFEIFLRVEFSVPKLLYGNNFDEVEEPDFGEVCWRLKEMLEYMLVPINDIKVIMNAQVSVIHFAKNIILTDYSTPFSVLREVSKIDVTRLLDTNQSDYRNEGHSFKLHGNDYEVTMYDKLKDLKQAKVSDKRAIEKDNYVQLNLFENIKPKKPFEALRFEVRLGSRSRIKEALKLQSISTRELTFINLFSKDIAKGVLIANLIKLEKHYPKILSTEVKSYEDLFAHISINNPDLSLKSVLTVIGAKAILGEVGARSLKRLTEKYGPSAWYRFQKEMNSLTVNSENDPFFNIREALYAFEKVELDKYKEEVYNDKQ